MLDDVRQLRQLVALASHDTLARAADSLGITKSALSQSVQRMEDIYGVPLFQRGRNGISPTIYGQHLIETARKSLALLHQSDRTLAMLRNLEAGRLVVGCDPVIAELLLAPALAAMARQHPGLRFVMKTGLWPSLREAFDRGDIDLFLGLKPDERITDAELYEIMLPPMKFYCRASHPLTKRLAIDAHDILHYPLVGPLLPKWFFERLVRSTPEMSSVAKDDLFLASDDVAVRRTIVRESDSITAGFSSVFNPDPVSCAFSALPFDADPFGKNLPGILVLRRDGVRPPASKALVAIIKDILLKLSTDAEPIAQKPS